MLAREKDLDAVLIATPDFVHAEQTNACLEAGLHVYCEQPMAHTIDAARSMVHAMRKTGMLLQIGHQRRSNPCYLYALNKIVKPGVMLGPITTAGAQWGRWPRTPRGVPKGRGPRPEVLARYGYENTHEFRNWGWYARYSAGPLVRLGTRQIDTWNWFLDTRPMSVVATGGRDDHAEDQWPDNVMAIYEYRGQRGTVRGIYAMPGRSVIRGHHIELLSGPMGSVTLAESPGRCLYHWPLRCKEQPWTRYVYERTIGDPLTPKPQPKGRVSILDLRGGSDTIPCPFARKFSAPPLSTAPGDLLRRDSRQGESQLPRRRRLQERTARLQDQRRDCRRAQDRPDGCGLWIRGQGVGDRARNARRELLGRGFARGTGDARVSHTRESPPRGSSPELNRPHASSSGRS